MVQLRMAPLVIAALAACSFDATGMGATDGASGGGGATSGGTGGSGSASASGTGGTSQGSASASGGSSSTSSSGTSTSGTSTSGGSSGGTTGGNSGGGSTGGNSGGSSTGGNSGGGSTGGNSGGGSTGGAVCPMPPPTATTQLWADAGTLTPPMMLATSNVLPGNPEFAFSEVAEAGILEWTIDVECEDDYYFWGLVWDGKAGTENKDPDSYFFSVDNSAEVLWNYGCTSGFQDWDDGVWGWSQVEDSESGCDGAPVIYATLAPGTHKVRVRNREKSESGGDVVAAIAMMLVSNDPNLDPYTVYAP